MFSRKKNGVAGSVSCRFMKSGEEDRVIDLVTSVFDDYIGPGYSEEGKSGFYKYADIEGLRKRNQLNHCTLVAEDKGKIVGAMEIRENRHISLFFVSGEMQKKGVGQSLFQFAKECCFQKNKGQLITVNASPNAVGAYKKMGFKEEGPQRNVNGLRIVPMGFVSVDSFV